MGVAGGVRGDPIVAPRQLRAARRHRVQIAAGHRRVLQNHRWHRRNDTRRSRKARDRASQSGLERLDRVGVREQLGLLGGRDQRVEPRQVAAHEVENAQLLREQARRPRSRREGDAEDLREGRQRIGLGKHRLPLQSDVGVREVGGAIRENAGADFVPVRPDIAGELQRPERRAVRHRRTRPSEDGRLVEEQLVDRLASGAVILLADQTEGRYPGHERDGSAFGRVGARVAADLARAHDVQPIDKDHLRLERGERHAVGRQRVRRRRRRVGRTPLIERRPLGVANGEKPQRRRKPLRSRLDTAEQRQKDRRRTPAAAQERASRHLVRDQLTSPSSPRRGSPRARRPLARRGYFSCSRLARLRR